MNTFKFFIFRGPDLPDLRRPPGQHFFNYSRRFVEELYEPVYEGGRRSGDTDRIHWNDAGIDKAYDDIVTSVMLLRRGV